ncbi:MAG: CARDB domain-containing protein [Bacteroidota bacterium]
MKRILLSLLFVAWWATSHGQCGAGATVGFAENFDSATVNMTSTGTPGWTLEGGLSVSSPNSYRGRFSFGDTAYLAGPSFNASTDTYVLLDFDQICKVSFFDRCQVQVSIDGGINWTTLTPSQYLGAASAFNLNNSFSSFDYPDWVPADDNVTPDNTWWKHESFDISSIAQSQPDVRVRFIALDFDGNGMTNNYGWLLDNIVVCKAQCELIKPVIDMSQNNLHNTIYNTGPYIPTAHITDVNGIVYTELQYSTNGSAGPFTGGVLGNSCGVDVYCFDNIPGANVGDSVCFFILAIDGSACFNIDTTDLFCFKVDAGITPPACENFDATAVWVATTISGSSFEWGSPNFGATDSAHSLPNCWDVRLDSAYVINTVTSVMSPVYDFSGACNPSLNFWFNSAINTTDEDGVQLQWTNDPTGLTNWTSIGVNGDQNGNNWYNSPFINAFSADPANDGWSGTSNGWVKATYDLRQVTNLPGTPAVRFAFVFKSSAFSAGGDGFSFDDFCVYTPPIYDAGISVITSPNDNIGVSTNQTLPVCLKLKNFGNQSMTATTIVCSLDGVIQFTYPWTGNLGCGQETQLCPLDSIVTPDTTSHLCCYISDAADGDHTNDSICNTLINVPTLFLSYCDDFESGNIGWTQQIGAGGAGTTTWDFSTPATSGAIAPHSGVVDWNVIDSQDPTAYANTSECYLYSPFFDFTSANSARMEFWINYDSEENWDGVTLEYTIDNGVTWPILGTGPTDPNATNWYNVGALITNQEPAWSGPVSGWLKASYSLCSNGDFNNQPVPVQFRYRFISDGSVVGGKGADLDDFCIYSSTTDDIGVSAINSPNAAAPSGDIIPVTVTVCNYGGTSLNGFPVTYTINGANPVTFNATQVLPPCTCVVVTLPPFTVPGANFDLCAYTGLLTDADNSNDTTCTTIISVPTLTPTYCDNFDSGPPVWYTTVLPGGANSTIWEQGTPNNTTGVTIGALSAPNAWDINLTSDYGSDADAALFTPFFDFGSVVNATMSFWQNRAIGGFNDGFYIEYSDDNGGSWNTLGTLNDTNAVNWYNLDPLTNGQPGWNDYSSGIFNTPLWIESQYNLNAFSNSLSNIQFRFHFVSGPFSGGDGVSIDNFCITVPPPQDAGVIAITNPNGFIGGNTTFNVNVLIKNLGSQPFSSTVINYSASTTPTACTGTFNWSGAALLPNQSLLLTNIGSCNSGNVDFGLCAWTDLPNDGDHSNDTLCKNVDVVPVYTVTYSNPYLENFDTTDGGWTSQIDSLGDPGSLWEYGAPNFNTTTGAHSGDSCWDINLNSAYTSDAWCYLYSPFFNLSNAADARIHFWHNYTCETGWDGTNLQYSFDGIVWNVLGVIDDSCGLDPTGTALTWYNDDQLNSSLQPAWTGPSGGWQRADYDIDCRYPGFTGVVQFRFQFTSDGSVTQDGYSIDDFEIEVPIPVTVSPQSIQATVNGGYLLFPGVPINFKTTIKNKGTSAAASCNATLVIDSTIIVTDHITFTPPLAKDSAELHTFSVSPLLSPGYHSVCVYTDLPNGTQDLNVYDDTVCYSIVVFDSTSVLPYCNDFESGSQWVTANAIKYTPSSSWQLGPPTQPFLNAAHSGTNAWTLGTNTNYVNNDTAGLFSLITTCAGSHCYKISFWHQFKMEEFQDGGVVEYSVDLGQTWKNINFDLVYGIGDNYDYVTALSSLGNINRGFTGTSLGWKYSEKVIRPGVTAPMIIRWRFGSDGSRDDEGWSVDDVCITDLGFCAPLSIDEITESGLGLGQNYPNPFTGKTTIEYTIPGMGDVQLIISDALGRIISVTDNKNMQPGEYQVELNDNQLRAGIYFYTLIFNGEKITKRMTVTD